MKKESTNKELPGKIQDPASMPGSTIKKHPVVLDNGKTIIFISDKSREDEIRLKYEIHANRGNHVIHSDSIDVPGNA